MPATQLAVEWGSTPISAWPKYGRALNGLMCRSNVAIKREAGHVVDGRAHQAGDRTGPQQRHDPRPHGGIGRRLDQQHRTPDQQGAEHGRQQRIGEDVDDEAGAAGEEDGGGERLATARQTALLGRSWGRRWWERAHRGFRGRRGGIGHGHPPGLPGWELGELGELR